MDTTNIFTVTPMSYNIELSAGQEYSSTLTIVNPANAAKDFNYKVGISPYAVEGDDYEVDFTTESIRTQIADWITIENPIGTLRPNEIAKVKFTIKVPETAPAGGQYAALMVSSNNENKINGNISISNVFEMASIIYANIKGETVRDGELIDSTIPGFVTKLPIRISATLVNNGNAHEIAKTNLEVKNLLSPQIIYPQPGESGMINEVIMPETSRYITRDITGTSQLGVYEVTQTINYLGQDYKFRQTVVICPIWFMVLSIVTVTAIVALIINRIKKYRRKRRVL